MVNMTYQLLIIVLPLVWLLIASIQDIKRREVANWISFSLVSFGITINVISSIINKTYTNLIYLAFILAGFAVISLILYYGRIFGGGDAKLLIALSPFLIEIPKKFHESISFNFPFAIVFLLNVVFIGSIYGVIWSIVLGIKNRSNFSKSFRKMRKNKKFVFLTAILLILSLISLLMFFFNKDSPFLFIFIILFILPFLFVFIKSVEESSMIRLVEPKDLTEGDWLAKKIKIGKKWIKPSEGLGLDEIKLLRKYKKNVLIKYGIPFVPVFLLAFAASLFFNTLIELVMLLSKL